jgi:DNA-binding transcriptional MerR regulator
LPSTLITLGRGWPGARKALLKEALRGSRITVGGEQKINRSAGGIDGTVQVNPLALNPNGVVSPAQDNHKRLYQPNQVIEVSVIAELRRKGFSLQNIRRVLRFLERELRKRLSEVLAPDSEIHLLTDGKSIYMEETPERIIDLLKDARQPMFLVCVTDQARRLATAAQRKPAKSEAPSPARKSIVA